MIQCEVKTIGIDSLLQKVNALPGVTAEATKLAINDSARKAQVLSKKEIESQVEFPKGYLNNKAGRLSVSKFASNNDPMATITGRFRATSLTRFVTNQSALMRGGNGGFILGRGTAKLKVKAGAVSTIDNAYLLRMKNGNIGFAVRAGKSGPRGTSKKYPIGNTGWWFLYGPSVNEVFNTVRDDVSPEVSKFLNSEFDRQFHRLMK
jgi:hypothetical protein